MDRCKHVGRLRLAPDHSILNPQKWHCVDCNTSESIWACLGCAHVACGRYIEEHALQHFQQQHHPLAMEVNELYVFCYLCDDYVLNDNATGDLKLLRSTLSAIQSQRYEVTTRSGRTLRSASAAPDALMPSGARELQLRDEDRMFTALWHRRRALMGRVFRFWFALTECGKKREEEERKREEEEEQKREARERRRVLKRQLQDELENAPLRKSRRLRRKSQRVADAAVTTPQRTRNKTISPVPPSLTCRTRTQSPAAVTPRRSERTKKVHPPPKPRTRSSTTKSKPKTPSAPPRPAQTPVRRKQSTKQGGSPFKRRPTVTPGVTGLRNLGNTCYMNSILQVLSHLHVFRECFLRLDLTQALELLASAVHGQLAGNASSQSPLIQRRGFQTSSGSGAGLSGGASRTRSMELIQPKEPSSKHISLCHELHTLFQVMWSGKWALVSPFAMLHSVWQLIPAFRGYAQQDAQEFLCELLDKVQHELENTGKHTTTAGVPLWASVDKSYQSLVKALHHGTAQALDDQMRGERKRWRDVVQELKDEHMKAGETVSLWQEYTHLSDRCSFHIQTLWRQWEELSRSSPQQDTRATVHSVEKLQDAAEDLQSSVGDVLAASKPLIGRLEPVAANLIQSETRLLSRDVLLLSQAMSGKKQSLQEDLEQQKLFHTRLEAVEKHTQNTQHKLKTGLNDTDSVKQVLLDLSDLFPLLVDVREMSGYVTLNNQETERLHMLSRQWVESVTRTSDMNRALQAERQRSQNFQEKCKNLTSIQKKLEEESSSSNKPQSFSSLQEMLTVHQRMEAEIITGHQLLHGLLCHAVESMETETGEKRSELMAQVTCMRESWFNSVALAGQRRSLIKEQLGQWRVYRRGSKLLWKLLRDVDPLLPAAGPALCSLHQLRSCADDYQCVKDALGLHSPVYTQTLEAGRHLCETMTESESQSRLQSELQAVQEAWERTTSLLEGRRDLVSTTSQKWSQCEDGITSITRALDELNTVLKQPLPERQQDSESEKHIQETDLALQRLTSGFSELATMKTDLSQYVAAGDSALLEQQLEQLHGQWEELCTKVSLRRQEIADRLNAWTIFNDKNKEFCDWLTQMENKVCHSGDLSIEEMVEKLKKDCMEEINLFSENKSHLKQLGEQLLLASDEAKQTQVNGSLQEVNQRWHNLFHHIEARVKKLKETLVAAQQLDKNMSNLRSWLTRVEAELSRPITYSVCHHQEIQRRLAEQQELQRDIEQHTEGVASVLSLCDVLLRDEDAAGGTEAESDSLQETSHSLDQRWRAICTLALDRRLRIEETWRLWCKFLEDYSRFEDWLKIAERTAANPNSADVLYTVAKEELKKFEGFQRQVHERLTQLELVNNQYRRLARENRTDRASQLKAMVHEGNRRWDALHRRVAAILRRLKYFTSQREDFEGTRESMVVWLTELDLQLTNVEHFSESDVHHKIQQLNSFQKEITLNTERIDGLIVFGEGLIQKSSPQDAALIEHELEDLHSYCQEVFSRLVRFHQRLSQPLLIKEEPELSGTTFSLESSLELIGRPWLGRSLGSLPATPTHLLASALERSGRETPVSVESLPLEWDHTGDVGGSSSHEDDDEEEEEDEDDRTYFSALSVSSRSVAESPRWRSQGDAGTQLDSEGHTEAPPALTSTPLKQGYLRLMSQCSGSIENLKRVSLILDDEEQPEELGLRGLTASDKQSGVIERWELHQAQSRSDLSVGPPEPRDLTSDLDDITSWLENVTPELERLQKSDPAASIEDMAARAKKLKEMQKVFTRYKSIMLSVNLRAQGDAELQERVAGMNRDWSRACTGIQQWDTGLKKTLMRCQEFHETLHSLLLWLAHAESRRYAVDISDPDTSVQALQQHRGTLTDLLEELQGRQTQQASLQALWSQLQPEDEAEESVEAQEKLHVTGSKLESLLRHVDQDLGTLQQRLDCESASGAQGQSASADPKKGSSTQREKRDSSPPRSFFYRVLRAAFPLHLLLLFLLLLPCLIPQSEGDPGCTGANNFARSFYPMLRYTNGPPPT